MESLKYAKRQFAKIKFWVPAYRSGGTVSKGESPAAILDRGERNFLLI